MNKTGFNTMVIFMLYLVYENSLLSSEESGCGIRGQCVGMGRRGGWCCIWTKGGEWLREEVEERYVRLGVRGRWKGFEEIGQRSTVTVHGCWGGREGKRRDRKVRCYFYGAPGKGQEMMGRNMMTWVFLQSWTLHLWTNANEAADIFKSLVRPNPFFLRLVTLDSIVWTVYTDRGDQTRCILKTGYSVARLKLGNLIVEAWIKSPLMRFHLKPSLFETYLLITYKHEHDTNT